MPAAEELDCCISAATLAKALCRSAGAEPLLTWEIKADKPAAKLVLGSVDVETALDVLDADSPFAAWKSACMNWPISLFTLLVAELEPSESSSPSGAPVVGLTVVPAAAVRALVPVVDAVLDVAVVPLVGCGIDKPRL